jgi:hypothetical protein
VSKEKEKKKEKRKEEGERKRRREGLLYSCTVIHTYSYV